jgi:hypothetical protein
MKAIKNIAILKPIIVYNAKEDKNYISKKGCMIVEYIDNTRNTLDLLNNVDLTNITEYEYKIYDKTKIKYIFKGVE